MYFALSRKGRLAFRLYQTASRPSSPSASALLSTVSEPPIHPSDHLAPILAVGPSSPSPARRDINFEPSRQSFYSRTSGNRASDAMQIIDDWSFSPPDKRPAAVKLPLLESIRPLPPRIAFSVFVQITPVEFSLSLSLSFSRLLLLDKLPDLLRLNFSANCAKLQSFSSR